MVCALDRVLIVMPALNEGEVISQVISETKRALPDVSILVVDDGSLDDTAQVARAAGADVLSLPFNLGVGGAMRLGFRYAQSKHFEAVVQLDSDGQHPPDAVPALIEQLRDADVVIGARFAGQGEYQVRGPRKWAMGLLSRVLSATTQTRLTDTTSGFKAHGPRAISFFAETYPAEYLGDTIEALILGHRAGLSFTQLGVHMRERAGGTPSHNSWKSALYLFRALFAMCIAYLRPVQAKRGF